MSTVAIILITIAFCISLIINLKYAAKFQHSLLLYSAIGLSFAGGASLLFLDKQLTPTTVYTTAVASNKTPVKQSLANPAVKATIAAGENSKSLSNARPGAQNEALGPESEFKSLSLFSGRTATLNIPFGKSMEISQLSCDIVINFQSKKQLVQRGDFITLTADRNRVERVKLDVVNGVVDEQIARSQYAVENRKPFSSGRPDMAKGRPSCAVQFRLI